MGTTDYAQMVSRLFVCLVYIALKWVCNPQKIGLQFFRTIAESFWGGDFLPIPPPLANICACGKVKTCYKFCVFCVTRSVLRITKSLL
jgi:hypothetical protein